MPLLSLSCTLSITYMYDSLQTPHHHDVRVYEIYITDIM